MNWFGVAFQVKSKGDKDEQFFPIVIQDVRNESFAFITKPEDLPVGHAFRVILTNATTAKMQIIEEAAKNTKDE